MRNSRNFFSFWKASYFRFLQKFQDFYSPFINTSSPSEIHPTFHQESYLSETTNRKTGGRNLHRSPCRTIPHKIPGFFDGNLGTVCVSNESAASTASIPFSVVETRNCKMSKNSGNFCKNGFPHVTLWLFFRKFPEFFHFWDEKFQEFL